MTAPSPFPDGAFLHSLADVADRETLPRFRRQLAIDTKIKPGYRFDPVTEADRQAELALRARIAQAYPNHAILGEEFGETGDGPVRWVLDPVDGTRPFLCGIPVWGSLIGLTVDGIAQLGMMSQPFTGERFWSDESGACYRRGRQSGPLRSSSIRSLDAAIVHTNAPEAWRGDAAGRLASIEQTARMIRYGGECYAFAMLAAGRIDVCIEPQLQPYDIVALIPIIERSGGVISCWNGARAENGGSILASANPQLHDHVLNLLDR